MELAFRGGDQARWAQLLARHEMNNDVLALYSRYLDQCPRAVDGAQVRELAEACALSGEEAYGLLLAASCGLDPAENALHARVLREYIAPGLRRLDAAAYRADPYLERIRFPHASRGSWTMTTLRYAPYELFVRNSTLCREDFTEIPRVGYFEDPFAYPAVLQGGREWMTVTPNEIETMAPAIRDAAGEVVAFGLGLGYFAFMAAQKADVTRVTVVERDPQAIRLFSRYILPQFPHPEKVALVQADAFAWAEKGFTADYAFVDLWHDVADGVPLYLRMRRLAARCPRTRFVYWIESDLLSNLRFSLLEQLQGGPVLFPSVKPEDIADYGALAALLTDGGLAPLALQAKMG